MENSQDSLDGWKQRYYGALEDLENREKQWAKVEQMLRQGLSRLTLAAVDTDAALNRQLKDLRSEIRKGGEGNALQAHLDAISESIRRLDEARKGQKPLPTPTELMGELLDKLQFPLGMGSRVKVLKGQLREAGAEQIDEMFEAFSGLLSQAFAASSAEPKEAEGEPAKKSLLGKFLGGKEERTSPARGGLQVAKNLLGSLIRSLVVEEASRESLSEKLLASEQEAQLQVLAEELTEILRGIEGGIALDEELPVNEVLVRLLERLDIPSELNDKVEAIKVRLLNPLSAKEMEQVIIAIAEIIAEMRSRMQSEKAEIENFLKQLTARLQEIDSSFQSNVTTQRESFRDGKALDDAVQVQVKGIEESVQSAEELDLLKELVKQRVDTIRTHMQEFRTAEEERLQKAEREVAELTEKLESVQSESNQLRQRLKDERNQALIDPLTGIPNRLAYNERLQQEVARWQRYQSPLVLSVWDVDKFKGVNDTYGHQAGDKVLTVIGKLLHKKSRETDFVARFGGEEFVLIMPETDLKSATVAAENLRKAVAETEFHFRGKRVVVTISCGMSEFRLGDDADKVFERADKALYQAKADGRNCCVKG